MVLGTPLKVNSENPQQSAFLGQKLGALLSATHLLCLQGELGTGKTTFVRGIVAGWQSTDRVTSPTYTILNIYRRQRDKQSFFHVDAYRLLNEESFESSGIDEIFEANGPVVIEWASQIKAWLPEDYLWIDMAYDTEDTERRLLTLQSHGPKHHQLLTHYQEHIKDYVISD